MLRKMGGFRQVRIVGHFRDHTMNRRLNHSLLTLFVLGISLLARSAEAWNPPGHMIIALIAYDKLDDATKAMVIELLRAHPRFQDHFQHFMPKDVVKGSQAEQDGWCLRKRQPGRT